MGLVYLPLFTYIWLICYGKCIGKYTSPMDPQGMEEFEKSTSLIFVDWNHHYSRSSRPHGEKTIRDPPELSHNRFLFDNKNAKILLMVQKSGINSPVDMVCYETL